MGAAGTLLALIPARLDVQRAARQLAECRVQVTGQSRRNRFPRLAAGIRRCYSGHWKRH